MIISVVLCEGVHDISFISKILCANGCDEYKVKIDDYPYPIGEQLKNNYARDAIGEKMIGSGPDSPFVPKAAYTDGKRMILFHNMNGDSDTNTRCELIDQYRKNSIALGFKNPGGITTFEFYLFYDADSLGVAGRLDRIESEFWGKYRITAGKPRQAVKVRVPGETGAGNDKIDVMLGTYIFCDPNDIERKGTLEDQLLALMRRENSELFDRAKDFLDQNALEADRTKEYDPKKDRHAGGKKYKPKKSQIAVAGQLQFSGMNNSVVILKSDYIKQQAILQDEECKKIAGMILG